MMCFVPAAVRAKMYMPEVTTTRCMREAPAVLEMAAAHCLVAAIVTHFTLAPMVTIRLLARVPATAVVFDNQAYHGGAGITITTESSGVTTVNFAATGQNFTIIGVQTLTFSDGLVIHL